MKKGKRLNLSLIDEDLLYKVLSIPTFSEKEYRMQDEGGC